MILFDLDGVIRDLTKGVCKEHCGGHRPGTWHWNYWGKNIFQYIAMDYSILERLPTTKYYKTIKDNMMLPEIWTVQSWDWRPYTRRWIDKHFKGNHKRGPEISFFYTRQGKYEALMKRRPGTFLVEDCPLFPKYDRIILIDRPYNKGVKARTRVKTVNELKKIINKVKLL